MAPFASVIRGARAVGKMETEFARELSEVALAEPPEATRVAQTGPNPCCHIATRFTPHDRGVAASPKRQRRG